MSVILVLIGVSLLVASGFLIAFFWAVRTGQYDDKYTPAVRILFEDELLKDHDEIEDIIHKKCSEKNNKNNSTFEQTENLKSLVH